MTNPGTLNIFSIVGNEEPELEPGEVVLKPGQIGIDAQTGKQISHLDQEEEDWGCGELEMPPDNGKHGEGEVLDSSGEIEEIELSGQEMQGGEVPPAGQNDNNSRWVKEAFKYQKCSKIVLYTFAT